MKVYIATAYTYWLIEADSIEAGKAEFDRRLADPLDDFFLQGESRPDAAQDEQDPEATIAREATAQEILAWELSFNKNASKGWNPQEIRTLGDLRTLLRDLEEFPDDTPVSGTYESRVNVRLIADPQWAPNSNPGFFFDVEEVD